MQLVCESVRASLAVTIDFHRARAGDTLIILQRTALFSRGRVTFIESRPPRSQNSIFGIFHIISGALRLVLREMNCGGARRERLRRSSSSRMEIFQVPVKSSLRKSGIFFFLKGKKFRTMPKGVIIQIDSRFSALSFIEFFFQALSERFSHIISHSTLPPFNDYVGKGGEEGNESS